MNAPEKLYLNPKHDRKDTPDKNLYNAWTDRQDDGDIPYRRERECVWHQGSPVGYFLGPIRQWHSGCGKNTGEGAPKGDYCPYCGGTIRVEEGDV